MRLGRWIVLLGVGGVVTVTALEGCSGGSSSSLNDVCASAAVCYGATPPTELEKQECAALVNEATCGVMYKAMKDCQTFRAKCNKEGAFDPSATTSACRSEINAYTRCAGSMDGGGVTDSCRARTCSQMGANCGEVDNGCGTKLQCGTCTNGQTCGGTTPNRCGCTCSPTMCGTLVACGTTVTCPNNCVAPQWCGGGGMANQCGCTPAGATGALTSTSVSTASISLDGGTQTSWSGAASARASDNANATATMNVGSRTQYLVALGFGVALPPSAIVDGIVVEVERSASVGLATADHAVHLVKATQIQTAADNKAMTGPNDNWPVAEATATYGGPTDKWGNTWTAAEINAPGFGVALSAAYTGQAGTEQARVDSIRVTVHYSGVVCQ